MLLISGCVVTPTTTLNDNAMSVMQRQWSNIQPLCVPLAALDSIHKGVTYLCVISVLVIIVVH